MPPTLDPAPHAPFLDARLARVPGAVPLAPDTWIERDGSFNDQMAYRDRLIADRRDSVFQALPGSEPAQAELLDTLVAHLVRQPGYARDGDAIRRPDGAAVPLGGGAPLAAAGRLVQEDICLLTRNENESEYRLAAGLVCFPSRWSLADKLGRPLTAIHAPVPRYDGRVAALVGRMFEGLRPGRPLLRFNWLVHASPELHQPEAGPQTPGAELWLRTERQTLTRLPATGAAAFAIKTAVTPFSALTAEQKAGLAAALSEMDAAMVGYRGGRALHGAALRMLGPQA